MPMISVTPFLALIHRCLPCGISFITVVRDKAEADGRVEAVWLHGMLSACVGLHAVACWLVNTYRKGSPSTETVTSQTCAFLLPPPPNSRLLSKHAHAFLSTWLTVNVMLWSFTAASVFHACIR
ncbi:hypothetical protein E2C01_025212 [Portunus trituberculatus]|uniref:Uncharacterized protein n=1 Tax=Portunus trituberculatus TaxID=210409 RepID=A0A5B7ECR5_PORTR|nr:hypothetical protein [Portunus trituberculatus]